MKRISFYLLIVFTIISCNPNETSKIEDAFYGVNEANIETNGNKMYELTSSKTHEYYTKLLKMTLEYDSLAVSELNIIDKINILSARAVLGDSVLNMLTPKAFFNKMYTEVNTMDSEKIKATRAMKIKDIRITGNEAKAELTSGGRSMPKKVYLEFSKENGEWKYNLLSIYKFTEEQLSIMCNQSGITYEDFIYIVFSDPAVQVKMVKPFDSLWAPILKD